MIALKKIFKIRHGNKFDMNKMSSGSICFVGRSALNNGVTGMVSRIGAIAPNPPGLISVALGGSVLSAFVQHSMFYTGQNVAILEPRADLAIEQKLYYCTQIKANAYRFTACGREANRFLGELLVNDISEIPSWVNDFTVEFLNSVIAPSQTEEVELEQARWSYWSLERLFDVKKGKRLTKSDMSKGCVPFIGAIDKNNGVSQYIGQTPIHDGNTITINYNGSVGESFYQKDSFWASDDVNVLYPKFKLNDAIGLFICTLLRLEKYRYNYGRKWHTERMLNTCIKLPVKRDGTPDWDYMERFIRALPFSSQLDS